MKLKTIALMIAITGILINAVHGMVVRVSVRVDISNSNGCPVYAINDRPVTRPALTNLLGRLASLDKDQCIYLMVDKQVSALSLVSTISDIQNTGLHSLVLICPAVENGESGSYGITVDARKEKFGGSCTGQGKESGFHYEDLYDRLISVEENVQKAFSKGDARQEEGKGDGASPSKLEQPVTPLKSPVLKMVTADHLFVVNGALPV